MADVSYQELSPVNNPTGNPHDLGYKELQENVSDSGLNDSVTTADTVVDSSKTYYESTAATTSQSYASQTRSTDSTGQRGGGAATTGEAEANRSKLLEKALDYIQHHYKPDAFEVTVKAVDIHLLDPTVDTIELGDVVKVILADGTTKAGTCLKIQYDLMAPENTEYTIGDAEKAIAS